MASGVMNWRELDMCVLLMPDDLAWVSQVERQHWRDGKSASGADMRIDGMPEQGASFNWIQIEVA
jgi:hypothetical protein